MKPKEIHGKIILVSALNWGYGHVSRCIDLIRILEQSNKIIIACSLNQKIIFKQFFPNVIFENLDEYPFAFGGKGNFVWDLFRNSSQLNKVRNKESEVCNEIVKKHHVDIVISDHRFGFRSTQCLSIFMTHQTKLALPFPLSLSNKYFQYLINKFDIIWLVDDLSIKLSGELSENINKKKSHYIGLLSRFRTIEFNPNNKIYNTIIISGPEEYWDHLLSKFQNQKIDYIVGPEKARNNIESIRNINFMSTTSWTEADEIIINSKKIYAYCGYTSLMDFHFLKCDYHCIPCPGQYEQVYLAKKSPNNRA